MQWVIDQSDYVAFEKGETLFKIGDSVTKMLIVTEGEYIIETEQQGVRREFDSIKKGDISGVLPFSRLKTAKGHGTALTDGKMLRFPQECFTELVNRDYALVQNLVALMSDRVRDFSQMRFQNEKLMALGKLSAGLAHELNNPASAMKRSAQELHDKLNHTPEKFKRVMRLKVTDRMTDEVNAILSEILRKGVENDLSLIERTDLEDDLTDWLEDHGIEDNADLTETFTDYNVRPEILEKVKSVIESEAGLLAVLGWLENVLSSEKLICEIKESSNRIAELVRSVKGYSHMDKAPVREPIDIKESLISTLVMLKHKIKAKQITVERDFCKEVPKINAYGGEINQIWTNILDNALDALPKEGILTVRTYVRGNSLYTEIGDNGSGISEDIITRIFDPFFTTKAMNEGTGMGLDIVKKILTRNEGDIQVKSKPGETVFTVCFPLPKPLNK